MLATYLCTCSHSVQGILSKASEKPFKYHSGLLLLLSCTIEAPLGGVLISRIPVIFWPNIPYPINSGYKYPGNLSIGHFSYVTCYDIFCISKIQIVLVVYCQCCVLIG